MTWQMGEAVPANLQDQLQFRIPRAEHVPMEEQARRASRFVSLLVGPMENVKQQLPSKEQLRWPLGRQVEAVEEDQPHQ